jgi:succinate-acetate transporter protein
VAAIIEIDTPPASPQVADPAPLGLAAFALTTFLLSGHNAAFIPDGIWIGAALFYGGLTQLLAGMWEFRNRNVFGATAFSSYGGFWLALGAFTVLAVTSSSFGSLLVGPDLNNSLAWFLIAFAIFNTYMLLWSTRVSIAVMAVFLTLEVTEIVLAIGFFRLAHGDGAHILHIGGWCGIVTAAAAWYASAAGVVNGMSVRRVVPVGRPLWGEVALPARGERTIDAGAGARP